RDPVPPAGLGGGLVRRAIGAQRRRRRRGAARGGRRSLQCWRGVLRAPSSGPLAPNVWLSRAFSCVHRCGGDVPFRRRVPGGAVMRALSDANASTRHRRTPQGSVVTEVAENSVAALPQRLSE